MNRVSILSLLMIAFFLSHGMLAAQNDVIYRQNIIHPTLLNPAITGSEYHPVAALSYQKQWLGIPQSPYSMLASASVRIGNFDFYNPRKLINTSNLKSRERIGLGLTVFGDLNGPASQRGINLSYAYHLSLDDARLSLGLSGTAEQRMVDESIFSAFHPNDPILGYSRESYMLYNANVGAYYYSPGLFAGLAIHHIVPSSERTPEGMKLKPDILFHGGYLFSALGRPRLEISANVRILDFSGFEADLHIRSYIQEFHWLAVSIRSYKAIAMHLGLKISAVHLVYSYEANLSNMVWYNMGTHALHLGINVGMRRIKGF